MSVSLLTSRDAPPSIQTVLVVVIGALCYPMEVGVTLLIRWRLRGSALPCPQRLLALTQADLFQLLPTKLDADILSDAVSELRSGQPVRSSAPVQQLRPVSTR